MSKMTLEQVRNGLQKLFNAGPGVACSAFPLAHWINAIEEHIQGDEARDTAITDAFDEAHPIYTHPPTQAAQERTMTKMLEDLAEVVAAITPRSPGGPWVAANFIRTHHATITNMAKRLEAAERDAARYRWLRGRMFVKRNAAVPDRYGLDGLLLSEGIYELDDSRYIDQAIDAAMQESGE